MAYRSTAVREHRGYQVCGPRTKGIYAGQAAAEVAKEIRRSKWTGRALIADVNRIARGTCQASLLWSIYYATEGAPHDARGKRWKAPEFTPAMLPEDLAKEGGFTPQQMREEIAEAIERGLIGRQGPKGDARYRFKLQREKWPSLPNAYVVRKPMGEADEENTGGYARPRETAGSRVPKKLQQIAADSRPAPVAIEPGRTVQLEPGTRYNFAAPVETLQYHGTRVRARLAAAGLLVILDRAVAAQQPIAQAAVASKGGYALPRETAVARNGVGPWQELAALSPPLIAGPRLQQDVELHLADTPVKLYLIRVKRRVQEMGNKFGTGLLRSIAEDTRHQWVFERKAAEELMARYDEHGDPLGGGGARAPQKAAAPPCARCGDTGWIGPAPADTTIPAMAAHARERRATFCECAEGRTIRELCGELLPSKVS